MTGDTRDPDDEKQDLKYDHRNLLTGMRVVKKSVGGDGYETYQLMYNYDEAGNRVRKRVYFYQGEDPTPVFEEDDMTGSWDLVGDEYYVRDVSGKEIAVYHSSNLDHWNVWGTDNVGKINANGNKFFYIKDHLGSVRVVLNSDNQIVSAIDYDCWGYPLENRSYQSDDIDYKFTGKQRDAETGYDYFGARYYDARIGRWGGVEPLLEKYIAYSPYQYGLLNPMKFVDIKGMDPRITINGNNISVEYQFYYVSSEKDKVYGLDIQQVKVARELLSNLAEGWTMDGVDFENKEYNITVTATLDIVDGDFNAMQNTKGGKFDNYIKNATGEDLNLLEKNVGVASDGTKYLLLAKGEALKPYPNSGAHELWHLLGGLLHSDARSKYKEMDDKKMESVYSIGGQVLNYYGTLYRDDPKAADWVQILSTNNNKFFNFGK